MMATTVDPMMTTKEPVKGAWNPITATAKPTTPTTKMHCVTRMFRPKCPRRCPDPNESRPVRPPHEARQSQTKNAQDDYQAVEPAGSRPMRAQPLRMH